MIRFFTALLCLANAAAAENRLPNPSFEARAADGVEGWTSRAWSGGDEARREQAETHQHEQRRSQQPRTEAVQFAFDVAQFGHGHAGYSGRFSSGSGARRCGASSSTVTTGHRAVVSSGLRMNSQPGRPLSAQTPWICLPNFWIMSSAA